MSDDGHNLASSVGGRTLAIVAVYGHNDGSGSIPSLLKSSAELGGRDMLLMSASRPLNLPQEIRWERIPTLNYYEYSSFLMFKLHEFISHDFVLLVQHDGWVLKGANWSDKFLQYDYIGAPCHAAYVSGKLFLGFSWVNYQNPIVIMNGGFSLRSKKLLSMPASLELPTIVSGGRDVINEDVQLTGIFRSLLEQAGIKFAPLDLARHFAIEYLSRSFHNDLNLSKVFGIHGKSRRYADHRSNTVSFQSASLQMYGEDKIISFLSQSGYQVGYHL